MRESAKVLRAGMDAAELFPGRATIYTREAGRALSITEGALFALIQSGDLGAVDVTGRPLTAADLAAGARRQCWRVPVPALTAFAANLEGAE